MMRALTLHKAQGTDTQTQAQAHAQLPQYNKGTHFEASELHLVPLIVKIQRCSVYNEELERNSAEFFLKIPDCPKPIKYVISKMYQLR